MIRPWEKFTVIEHQVGIDYIAVVRRSRGVLVAEIGTTQKYPEVLGYSGTELHLLYSERTPYVDNEDLDATSVVFPRAVRGWNVVTPRSGRYSIVIALCKPPRRRPPERFTRRDEDWRARLLLKGGNR